MLIARGVDGKDQLIILGLSHENIAGLLAGHPMVLKRESHGDGVPEGWEIVIFTGNTEADLAREFQQSGLIGPDTQIRKDPRL